VNAFSKDHTYLEYQLALSFAYYHFGSLVIPGIHNSMIFRANKECPYKSRWIL